MIRFQLRLQVILTLLAVCGIATAQEGDEKRATQAARVPRDRIPLAPPLKPEEAIKTFKLPPGFHIEPVAAEPMIENPVVLQFDPDDRAWVVEMRGFMPNADGKGEDRPVGQVSILEDTNGDGRMDRKTVFLDGLVLPRALLLVKGGILVCEPPALWFYPNRNDKPGPRWLVADDFAAEGDPKRGKSMSVEHAGNSLVRNLDNWIYSLYHPYRYRQAGDKWLREPMPLRAQWGLAQDDFGRLFYTSNSDQLRGDMVPSHYFSDTRGKSKLPGIGFQVAKDQTVWPIRVNPGVNRAFEPDTLRADGTLVKFTAACGTCVYRGDLFRPEFHGNAFVCEPSANLVRRNILSEKDGFVTGHNAYNQSEFLASTDEIFRPVNVYTGPDGALYVVDMYHGIIQHRAYLTPYLRAQSEERGLEKVTNHGRIWRIVPEGKVPSPKTRLSEANSIELVGALSHPNGWWRDTAQRLLVERDDASVVPALEKLGAKAEAPVTRLHALWSLEGMGRLAPATINAALDDPHPKVRAAAIRLSEHLLQGGGNSTNEAVLRSKILDLVSDVSPDVQIQLALSLGSLASHAKAEKAVSALALTSPVPLAREAAGFSKADPATPETNSVRAVNAAPLTREQQKRYEAGRAMYEITCLACHQQHGLGQAGLAPALAGSEWVSGSDRRLIRIVLNGLRGPIQVKGETFELEMPALGVLDDEQIASVLTYIRREWGHTFEPVEPAAVKAVREETARREDAWTMAELLKVP
jgi:mono/diheme cytochrome c family protein/glucose/arabinose dehydrogenase